MMAEARMEAIAFRVNGEQVTLEADPEMPLLYALRNDLELNAAKYGCGLGRCGSCTVHIEGKPAFSCLVTMAEVAGTSVTTLEGLAPGESLHPLQHAILDEQAAQCGYCIPGIVMTAAALLEANPAPSDADVRQALAGTLCRCGSQPRILRAIRRAIAAREVIDDRA
jgi:aerobic-type carbon monoxide dehydrogenase small subunit (CoxS/CutS family)